MKKSQGQKEKRKNNNSSSKGVVYVPKSHKMTESVTNTTTATNDTPTTSQTATTLSEILGNEVTTRVQALIAPPYGKLTKDVMLSLYAKRPVPSSVLDGIKASKEIYSEESIVPASLSEFTLPMAKAIMPPRKIGPYESKDQHGGHREMRKLDEEYSENDQGIITAADNSHSNVNNAPLWFDSEVATSKKADLLQDDEEFTMENLAKRQLTLEEEKAKFMKGPESKENTKTQPEKESLAGTKVDLENIFKKLGDEAEDSNIDVKYVKSLRDSANKISNELFSDPAIKSSGSIKGTIDAKSLETEMLKGTTNQEAAEDDGEEKPVWDAFSAEEIKQHTQKNIDNWGLTLAQDKNELGTKKENRLGKMEERVAEKGIIQSSNTGKSEEAKRPVAPPSGTYAEEMPTRTESKNPFCHSSLNIKETDRVWHYKDIQNCLQGPFTSIEMYVWYKAGYFPQELPLRCNEHSPFIPLGEFLNSVKPKPRVEPPPAVVPVAPVVAPAPTISPIQHFDHSNMAAFFDPAYASMDASKNRPGSTTLISLEELESGFRPLDRTRSDPVRQPTYYKQPVARYMIQPAPVSYYVQNYQPSAPRPYEDPAIASARIGGPIEAAANHLEGGYITDEANDLKALLGMPGNNSKPIYR